MLRIGIDPDIRNPGFAVMINGKYTEVKTISLLELQKQIYHLRYPGKIFFSLENVLRDSPTYGHSSGRSRDKISQNVGMCKAAGMIIAATLADAGHSYELVSPLAKTGNGRQREFYKRCHKDGEFFNKFTGWEGRTNNDGRCAAMLLYRYHKLPMGGV